MCDKTREVAFYTFDQFRFDPHRKQLWEADTRVDIQRMPLAALEYLITNRGRVVSREELREQLWGNVIVQYELGLNFMIRQARAALGDDARKPRFIETVRGQGYRFVAPVRCATRVERKFRARVLAVAAVALVAAVAFGFMKSDSETGPAFAVEGTTNTVARMHYRRGVAALRRRLTRSGSLTAETELALALDADSGFGAAAALLSIAENTLAFEFGQIEKAERAALHLTQSVALAPGAPETVFARAFHSYYGGAYDQTIAVLSDAEDVAGFDRDFLLGYAHRKVGDWEAALPALRRALNRDPYSIEKLSAVALTYAGLGDYSRASEYLEMAIQVDPARPNLYVHRALVRLAATGKVEEAVAVLSSAPQGGAVLRAAAMHPVLGRAVAGAVDVDWDWAPALSSAIDSVEFFLRKARYHVARDESQAAVAALNDASQVLQANPHRGEGPLRIRIEQALLYASLGSESLALRQVAQVLRSIDQTPDGLREPWVRYHAAGVFLETGREAEAIDQLRAALNGHAVITPALIRADPAWRSLRANGEFRSIAGL